ncbi:MAG: alpha-galactosidase [Segetibacter sp.]
MFITSKGFSQLAQCKAVLKNDTLTIENSKIKRTFYWNNGNLITIDLFNKINNHHIGGTAAGSPDVVLPGVQAPFADGRLMVSEVEGTAISYPYLAAEVITKSGTIELKRVFKIYADCPAIACDYYLRGQGSQTESASLKTDSYKNIEDEKTGSSNQAEAAIADKISISENNWKIKTVEFFDATDYNNNLVQEFTGLIYRQEKKWRGNLLTATNTSTSNGFFILKEAPVSTIQLYYPGYDFTTKWGEIKVTNIGVVPRQVDTGWVRGYSTVIGINEQAGEMGLVRALRAYQQIQRKYDPQRDDMIVSNTWGDRNRDTRVNEHFILQEIDSAAKLGITRLQIDDGWQKGKSSNSAFSGSLTNIWRNKDYWDVDSIKFPGGLEKIISAAKNKGMQVSLWFNPSTDSSFKYWEKDADVLIAQYKRYPIKMWKIDGVQAPDKLAEINFRKMLDKVMQATNNEAIFNLDVTAGRRFGYFFMYRYGNLFLENRYTDWGNYYPYFTLRNLWQLSRYMPARRLQVEFLNKWRNASKYPPSDPFAPANYSFDYLFTITMMAQPLAWFEVSGLPKEAMQLSKLINKYKTVSSDIHTGQTFPIGDEPDGFSWTGFQSLKGNSGFFLVYREDNGNSSHTFSTLLAKGAKIDLKLVAGDGKNLSTVTGKDGNIVFTMSKPKSFALYRYSIGKATATK